MPNPQRILIVGHSHIGCLSAAARNAGTDTFEIVNLGKAGKGKDPSVREVLETIDRRRGVETQPHAVCVCINGNQHNILGIVENPRPFRVGQITAGATPAQDESRWFIPFALIKDNFEASFSREVILAIYERFPTARRFYLNPPPPISDWEFIKAHPSKFEGKLGDQPVPLDLRMQLYLAQTAAIKSIAHDCDAQFIELGDEVKDGNGFLKRRYYGSDPTHANAEYGALMLDRIQKEAVVSP
ncbi:hypothetical protein [Rhodobacter sp. NSM]|uniref:hypothetical protein n=1 Tax=Rhodobacter sp. NSM TaxID=3457501 RepID=UPI003FD06B10